MYIIHVSKSVCACACVHVFNVFGIITLKAYVVSLHTCVYMLVSVSLPQFLLSLSLCTGAEVKSTGEISTCSPVTDASKQQQTTTGECVHCTSVYWTSFMLCRTFFMGSLHVFLFVIFRSCLRCALIRDHSHISKDTGA